MRITKVTLAGLSSVLYHVTDTYRLLDILKENKIHMTSNLGTNSDKLYRKKKFRPYFFSLSRIKYGGYSRTRSDYNQVTLVFDGLKLRDKFYGQPVDYWGEGWRKTADEVDLKERNKVPTRLKYDENEERIYSDKPFIEPITQYVKEIHIIVSELSIADHNGEKLSDEKASRMYEDHRMYRNIGNYCTLRKIPCYFYFDFSAYKLLNKKKAGGFWSRERSNHLTSFNELFKLDPNISESDARTKLSKDASSLLFTVIYSGDQRDLKPSVECDIHNAKAGNKAERAAVDDFIVNMRKNRLKNLDEVFQFFEKRFAHLK